MSFLRPGVIKQHKPNQRHFITQMQNIHGKFREIEWQWGVWESCLLQYSQAVLYILADEYSIASQLNGYFEVGEIRF